MSWTKQQLIEQAFAEIGLSVNVFNISPENLQSALRNMDAMMGTWNGRGIRVGYGLPATPADSVLDDLSGVPDSASEAVYLNLALRIAPAFGKAVGTETKANARAAYEVLLSLAAFPPEQQLPNTLPRGAGQKPWRYQRPFMPTPVDPLVDTQGDGQIDFD
ncbi:MAG: packaged DNA stabilization gp4 family protein [Pseudomonadota bacterium]